MTDAGDEPPPRLSGRSRVEIRKRPSRSDLPVGRRSLSSFGLMTHHDRVGLHCHSVALIIEAVGTLFVFLDAVRMNVQLHAAGFASYAGGPPPGYESWIYHSAHLGFGLLFFGMLVAGYVLWRDHRALLELAEATPHLAEPAAAPNSRPPSQLPTVPENQTPDSQRTPSSGGCGWVVRCF